MAELLLRLFQSEFFSPALGVSYLRFYSDSIGITWHLIHLLRTRYSAEELAFYWPQLCHLLLTTPSSDSLALETYILDIAAADPHTALITSWIFQAALRDLAASPNTPSFRICQRILNHCHHILFHTPDLEQFLLASATESLQAAQLQQSRLKREILEKESHTRLLQQLGASSSDSDVALSLPATTPSSKTGASSRAGASASGSGAEQQLQQHRPFQSAPPSPPQQPGGGSGDISSHAHSRNQPYLRPATSSFLLQQLPSSLLPALLRRSARPKVLPSNALTTLVGAGAILASAPGQPLLAKETAMVAVLQGMRAHDRNQVPTRLTEHGDEVFDENEEIDPNLGPDGRLPLFGIQRPVPPKNPAAVPGPPQPPPTPLAAAVAPRPARLNHAPASASASSIFLPGPGQGGHRSGLSGGAGKGTTGPGGKGIGPGGYVNLSALPKAYLSSLLRTHYFRAQTRMLQQLQDISSRLLLHPKPERLAALRSELTSLNHTLPSEVCLPLWCECGPDASTMSAIARAELNASAAVAAAEAAEAASDAAGGHGIFDETRFQLLNGGSGSNGGAAGSASSSSPSAGGLASAPKDAQASSTSGAPPSATAAGFISEPITKPEIRHHRIVRISPHEAVVLNSADRAPYLLHVEVLRNDLDFDPERRGNRQLCERLVRGEQEGRARRDRGRETSGSGSVGAGSSSSSAAIPNSGWDAEGAKGEKRVVSASASINSARSRHPSSAASVSTAASEVAEGRLGPSSSSSSGGRAQGEKALPSIPPPLVSSATASATPGQSKGKARTDNADTAGFGTNAASGINPMSDVGPGPSPALADPDGPLETMFADLAMGDVGARGNEEALAAAAATLASSSGVADGSPAEEEAGAEGDGADGKPKKSMGAEDLATVMRAVNKDDPSAAMFRESWAAKKARIRKSSPYGHLPEWDVFSMIVKTGADLRQEQLAVQLIHEFGRIWAMTGSECWVRYFRILVTGEESGLMETITDSVSVHSIKKEAYSRRLVLAEQAATAAAAAASSSSSAGHGQAAGAAGQSSLAPPAVAGVGAASSSPGGASIAAGGTQSQTHTAPGTPQLQATTAPTSSGRMQTYSLFEHFQEAFGEPDSASYREAQENFIRSLAGYSIISYLLQIKDRHNGNILIDHQGHIIHIDFGFMLGISPGGVGFEAAPFKFPQEYIDILGGIGSEAYERFKALMRSGFRDVRKHAERIIMIVELMQRDSKLPCFALNETCAVQLRDRFQLGLSQTQCDEFVDRLVLTSAGSVYTRLYDRYQSFTQGIL